MRHNILRQLAKCFCLILCVPGNFPRFCCQLLNSFSKSTFSKNSFRNTIRMSNGLDPDQDRHSVGPDLGPNCFANVVSRRQKSLLARIELKVSCTINCFIFYLLIVKL